MEKKKIKVFEEQKAEEIKELCYRAICNPDLKLNNRGKNMTFEQRRKFLLKIRKDMDKCIAALDKTAKKVLKQWKPNQFLDSRMMIFRELNIIMSIVTIIDKYSIDNTKAICKSSLSREVLDVAQAYIYFPAVVNDKDVTIFCTYYEDICLNKELLKQFRELKDEERLNFIKEHVVLGNITILDEEYLEKARKFAESMKRNQVNRDTVVPEPVYVSIDDIYDSVVDKEYIMV